MRILHAFNAHRLGGGSDNAFHDTIRVSRDAGLQIGLFLRDSKKLSPNWPGKLKAFVSGVYAPDAVADFKRAMAEFKPHIVHTHELFPLISPWILPVCTAAGVPVVHTCYDFRLTCPVATHFARGQICHRCLGGREYWAVLKNCRNNIAESIAFALRSAVARKFDLFRQHVSQFIVQTGFGHDWLVREVRIPAERVTINPCAIDLPGPAADPAAGSYIGFASRLVPEKGADYLIEAARRTGLPVRIASNAWNNPATRSGDPVQCVDIRSREDMARFYRNARMVVMPSIWYETFGLVAAEAMSHAIPVIASRIGALRETVQDGRTGLLFEPGNVDELAACMMRLWHDPDLCRSLGMAGRQRIAIEFSSGAHRDRLIACYDRAIAGGLKPERGPRIRRETPAAELRRNR